MCKKAPTTSLQSWVCVQCGRHVRTEESGGLRVEAPLETLSFGHQTAEALNEFQQAGQAVTGMGGVLTDFESSGTAWVGADVVERERLSGKCAQLSAPLSGALWSWTEQLGLHSEMQEDSFQKHFGDPAFPLSSPRWYNHSLFGFF